MLIRGSVATSSGSEAAVENTTYTEQTSGAQRSLASSSASDAAAGTGIRTVQVRYFTLASDGTITGPFYETVTLNGATAVAMVATNVALVDSVIALTAGSGGVAAGTITLYTDALGLGSAIATIAVGDRQTRYAHTYVPSGRRAAVSVVSVTNDDLNAVATVRSLDYSNAHAAERGLFQDGVGFFSLLQPIVVAGPARVRAYVTPSSAAAQTTRVTLQVQMM
jgi:hypothetical protein